MQWQSGDVLFQDIGCGAVCDAINGSTLGWRGAEINHCGLLLHSEGEWLVAEAIAPTVRITRVDEFLRRATDDKSRPRVIQARLKDEFLSLVPSALTFSINSVGLPYDSRFGEDGTALYCSELIVDAFWHANSGNKFFEESPMSFSDPETGEILSFWIEYYAYFGENVPQGDLGSNPGELSLSEKFGVYHQLGTLRGLEL